MTPSAHSGVHGLLNNMADSMAIKREIIFDLAKEIPPKKIPEVVDKLWDKTIGFRQPNDVRRHRRK